MHYICPPLLPLTYISFLSPADVVEAEVLDTEALLCLVKTPQPLALHRPTLTLPALSTPRAPRSSKREGKEVEIRQEDSHSSTGILLLNTRLTVPPGHTSHSTGLWQTDRTDSPGDPRILPRDASLPENYAFIQEI